MGQIQSLVKQFKHIHTLALLGFKSRNEGSFLGIFWYLLNPLLMFGLLLSIFYLRVGEQIEYYPLYLLLGIIIFNFFRQVTTESTIVLENQRFIVKATTFPLSLQIGAIVYKLFLSHIIEIILIGIALVFFGLQPLFILWYIPLSIFFLLFVYGCALILSLLNTYIADIQNMWIFLSQLLFFATPIFYSIGGQEKLFYLNLANPLFYFISIARDSVIYGIISPLWMYLGVILWSVLFFGIGLLLYNVMKHEIAEMI